MPPVKLFRAVYLELHDRMKRHCGWQFPMVSFLRYMPGGQMIRIVAMDDTTCSRRHWRSLVFWFSSPFWAGQAGVRAATDASIDPVQNLLGQGGDNGSAADQFAATALCDSYHLALMRSWNLEPGYDTYESCEDAHLVRVLDDEGCWREMPASCLQLVLVDAAARHDFPAQALAWIAKSLSSWSRDEEGAVVATLDSLMPGPTGMALRRTLLGEDEVAVPAFALPLVATLMPEISYRFAPIDMSFQEWQRISAESMIAPGGRPPGLPRVSMRSAPRASIQLKSVARSRARLRSGVVMALRTLSTTAPGRWVRGRIVDAGWVPHGTGSRLFARLEHSRTNPFMGPGSPTHAVRWK